MALVVEDGSIVANADSYISLADARTRATVLGVSISSTDGTAELQLQQATIYNDRKWRAKFQGFKVLQTQSLQWPRTGVEIDGYLVDSDEIPQEVIDAQIYTAAHLETGTALYPDNDGKNVKMEEVTGAVKVEYFNMGKTGTEVAFSDTEQAIRPTLGKGGGSYSPAVRR
tara:strand:- start:3043 stop:3552 length:510 start_codon:yes stop_codon:yes gene_type:complete